MASLGRWYLSSYWMTWKSLPGKDLACWRRYSFACSSEVKWNQYKLCLHKEFGESVVGWFGERQMEPMQCLAPAKASMDLRTGEAHCSAWPWETKGAPITLMFLPAGGNKATESRCLETREVPRHRPCVKCIASTPYTFVSAPFVLHPAF